jgi:hypothetical protein
VMKEDALESLMGTYQQAGNQAKVIDTANRLLVTNPNNVRALVLLAFNERAAQKWADARQHAEKGLQALPNMLKPDGVSDADFAKQKTQLGGLLNSVAGFSALQLKDNAAAEKYLRAAVDADPNNVENVYPLALASLTATPEDDVNGLFFIARAANLVKDPAGKAQIVKFGHSKYVKYHGSEDGWNELLAQTATTLLPPAGFTIKQYVPPTPAEQAADLVKTKTPKDMSFAEWELVLSAGAPADADKVWSVIKGVPLQMEGTVMKAAPTELQIAASQDDIDAKRADIVVTMGGTIPAKLMPQVGATLDFEGTPASYGKGRIAHQGSASQETTCPSPRHKLNAERGIGWEFAGQRLNAALIFCLRSANGSTTEFSTDRFLVVNTGTGAARRTFDPCPQLPYINLQLSDGAA